MKYFSLLICFLFWGCAGKSAGSTSSAKKQEHEQKILKSNQEDENDFHAEKNKQDSPTKKKKKKQDKEIKQAKMDTSDLEKKKSNPGKKIRIVKGSPLKFKQFKVKLKTRINALDVSPDCKNIVVGGKMMDLSLITSSGKNKFQINHIRNNCRGKRCKEGVVPYFLADNKTIIAALNGDTLRKFNIQGKALAFRGGYLGKIKQFSLFNSKKYAAAQYSHGLAIWRTTSGLVGKINIPFKDKLFFGKSDKFLQKTSNYLLLKNIKNKVKHKIKEKRNIVDAKGTKKEWIILYPRKLELFSLNLSKKTTRKIPEGYKPVKVSGRIDNKKVRIIARKENNWYLLVSCEKKFKIILLKNLPQTEDCFIYLSPSLVVFGRKKSLWIHDFK